MEQPTICFETQCRHKLQALKKITLTSFSLRIPFFIHPQLEEAWLDDEHSEFLEQLKMEMLEEQQREEMELAALQEEQEYEQVRQQQNRCFV